MKKQAHQITISKKPKGFKVNVQDDVRTVETLYCDDLVTAVRCVLSHYEITETGMP